MIFTFACGGKRGRAFAPQSAAAPRPFHGRGRSHAPRAVKLAWPDPINLFAEPLTLNL